MVQKSTALGLIFVLAVGILFSTATMVELDLSDPEEAPSGLTTGAEMNELIRNESSRLLDCENAPPCDGGW